MLVTSLKEETMPVGIVRRAGLGDVQAMVALAEDKRRVYAEFQPRFWRPAPDAANQQAVFLAGLVTERDAIILVDEDAGKVDGFLVATLAPAPPVYAPGGLTCVVDDFWVDDRRKWPRAGAALLAAARNEARARGAVQMVVVAGNLDDPKRALLAGLGHTIASEWWVRDL